MKFDSKKLHISFLVVYFDEFVLVYDCRGSERFEGLVFNFTLAPIFQVLSGARLWHQSFGN